MDERSFPIGSAQLVSYEADQEGELAPRRNMLASCLVTLVFHCTIQLFADQMAYAILAIDIVGGKRFAKLMQGDGLRSLIHSS